jgi:hypothetical protein
MPTGREKSSKKPEAQTTGKLLVVERVQTGVRLEKRILQVLKGTAEYYEISLGDLLEGIVLHAFEGKSPFGPPSLQLIEDLKRIYHLDLSASASHQLREKKAPEKQAPSDKVSGNETKKRAPSRGTRRSGGEPSE